jgi:hypothetical protein
MIAIEELEVVKKEMAVAYLLLISYDNTVWKAGIQFKI